MKPTNFAKLDRSARRFFRAADRQRRALSEWLDRAALSRLRLRRKRTPK